MSKPPQLATEHDLVRRCQDDEERACEELVCRLKPMVHRLAKRFSRSGLDYEDLWQVGQMAIVKSISRFDVSRGVKLSTYAEATALGEMKHHFRDFGWAVHMPRDLQELSAKLRSAANTLGGDLSREATPGELAEAAGVDEGKAEEAVVASRSYSAASLDAPVSEDGASMHAYLGDDDEAFTQADARLVVSSLYRFLPKRERRVVALRFYCSMTQAEIAEHVGVSQMHVSRLLSSATERLRPLIREEELAS